jgi:hypothetical protein
MWAGLGRGGGRRLTLSGGEASDVPLVCRAYIFLQVIVRLYAREVN